MWFVSIIISTIVFALLFGFITRAMSKRDFSVNNVIVAAVVYFVLSLILAFF